jgi:hypothetical protein
LAISYKNEGIIRSMNNETIVVDKIPVKIYFDSAVSIYRQVSDTYLSQQETIIGISGADELVTPKKTLFIYPDFRAKFHPTEREVFTIFIPMTSSWNIYSLMDCLIHFIPASMN